MRSPHSEGKHLILKPGSLCQQGLNGQKFEIDVTPRQFQLNRQPAAVGFKDLEE
jgi:hypothetical protein